MEALVAVVEYDPVVAEVEPQGGYQVALWRRGERAKEAHVTKRLLSSRLVSGCVYRDATDAHCEGGEGLGDGGEHWQRCRGGEGEGEGGEQ